MTIAETLLLDFEPEAMNTRRVLERVPQDRADWTPHERSMSLGSMAAHVASLADFGRIILTTPSFDFSKEAFPKYTFTTVDDLIRYAAGAAGEVRTALGNLSDEALLENWQLLWGGQVLGSGPRVRCYRTMFFNHLMHHRGQLCVYLRLLDVPVPALYGPSADEEFVPPTEAAAG